jgi:hypothetical protein
MKLQDMLLGAVCAAALAMVVAPAVGQTLYMQNFDVDDSANWTVNNGPGDEAHDFFFDYSTVGIPSAPNAGGTTRGMKLQANLSAGVFSGMSVSPTGQSFTGDYALTFDVWSNYIGNETNGINNIAATTGSSMLSQFGILTSGTVANWPGVGDGVWFTAMSDTSSTAYRVYSSERVVSYKGTYDQIHDPTVYDAVRDPHNTYYALNPAGESTRSNNPNSTTSPAGQLYLDTFPVVTVPTEQTNADPDPGNPGVDLSATQFGSSPVPGVFGFKWHQVEISKVGNIVNWKVDGTLLATVDTTNFTTPTGGNNILFGHSDINGSFSSDPNFPFVQFTLVDNVKVTAISAAEDADFDNDGDVDGNDFLIWQRGNGTATGATNGQGDANNGGSVDAADLAIWKAKFGTGGTPAAGAASAVPEPATWGAAVVALLTIVLAALPRRRAALARAAVSK